MLLGYVIENDSINSEYENRWHVRVTFTKGVIRPEHYHVGINDLF